VLRTRRRPSSSLRSHIRRRHRLNLLVYLDALLSEANVARAARRAALSQSGMTRALARLRAHFHDPLFVATGRGLSPTPFASGLRRPLEDCLRTIESVADRRASFDPAQHARSFRIASSDYSTLLLLAPLQRVLESKAPGTSLDVIAIDRGADEIDLDRVDLVIGPKMRGRPRVITKRLFNEDFCVVARAKHPLMSGRSSVKRYAEASHVLVTPGGQPGSLMDSALASHGLERRVAVRLPTFLSVPAFLVDSDHVATLPRRLARRFVADNALAMRELPIESPKFAVTLAFQAERERDPAHRWLRQRLTEIAGQRSAS
jgi:DNA-binding transcriptional LysR family regulator